MANFYVPFDFETGGLNEKTSDALTLYICVMDEEFKLVDELNLKLKPDGRLPIAEAGALRVNGINLQDHLANPETIPYSEAKKKVITMLRKYLKKNGRYSNLRPLGQNIPFDLRFMWEHVVPKDEWDSIVHYGLIDTKPIVDFFKDAGVFPKDIGNLGSIVEYLKIPKRNAHNAKDDTLMTVDVYRKLLDIIISQKNNEPRQDLIALLEAE